MIRVYTIYQGTEENKNKFMSFDFAKNHGGIKREEYDEVWNWATTAPISDRNSLNTHAFLESLWNKFNINRPKAFKGHSLSVSDIVLLTDYVNEEKGIVNNHLFYCDSFGWKEISLEECVTGFGFDYI